MMRVSIQRDSGASTLVERCSVAQTMWSRAVGLLNHATLPLEEGLLIRPCNNVHTFFMRFPIDVVFLDAESRVLGIRSLKPWRVSPIVWKAKSVLELAAGVAQAKGLRVGEKLECVECSN